MANNDDINSAKTAALRAAETGVAQKIEWTRQERRDFANRLRKISDSDLKLKDALLKDLYERGWSKPEFAEKLEMRPSTVAWWFTKDHIPMSRYGNVIECLGTNSKTFEILLERAQADAKSGQPQIARDGHKACMMLEGYRAFNKHMANVDINKAESLVAILDRFYELYPEYHEVYKRKMRDYGRGAGGLVDLPVNTKAGLAAVKAHTKAVAAGEVTRSRKVHFTGSKDEDLFFNNLQSLCFHVLGKEYPLPTAKHHKKQKQKRPFIISASDHWLIGAIVPGWTVSVDSKGKEYKMPFLSMVRGAGFELLAAQNDAPSTVKDRKLLLVIYDSNGFYKEERSWVDQVSGDLHALGIINVWVDDANDAVQSVGEIISPKEDTIEPIQIDEEDDPSVEIL